MKLDFHVHSTASDGTLAPAQIAQRAAKRGFSAIALTDHDNCDGIAEFLSCECPPPDDGAPQVAVKRFAGIELSIEPGEGFDKFHLLGLGIDPSDKTLRSFLSRILEGRNERNAAIIENFGRIGIHIPKDEIASYAHGDVLARPHFAKWLADHGFAADIKSAFAQYLLPDSPKETRCYEERFHPPQDEAFQTIHGAGGICIMAHPKYWRREWRIGPVDYDAARSELLRLKDAGLDGLESLYQANYPREDVAWTILAERTGLLKSAGSDFHGDNKPDIKLGMTVEPFFAAPLLERLGMH